MKRVKKFIIKIGVVKKNIYETTYNRYIMCTMFNGLKFNLTIKN